MDGDSVLQGIFHVGDDRKLFPLGLDQLHGVLGLAARLRDDRRDRLALPAGAIDRDRMLRRRLDPLQVPEHRNPGLAVLRYRGTVKDGNESRLLDRF